jgi:hypothetical protein
MADHIRKLIIDYLPVVVVLAGFGVITLIIQVSGGVSRVWGRRGRRY